MTKLISNTTLLFITLLAFGACSQNDSEVTEREAFRKEYSRFKTEMNKNIANLEKKIDQLQNDRVSTQDKISKKYEAAADEFTEMKENISETIDEMEDATKDRYVDMKTSVENSYQRFKAKVEKLTN